MVLSLNIDLDVIVGNGWTRITLREVPRFLVNAFDRIMSDGLSIDGIFRKEGNSARLNRDEIPEVYRGVRPIPEEFTVLDVCTMIKRFLRDLKPTLLNSTELRTKLLALATKAKSSEIYELTHTEMVQIFETNVQHLSPAHLGTLGYVVRFLNRISKHSDTHKMTSDNLAVVLVGSIFGDFMCGSADNKKKGFQARRRSQAELQSKKDDMELQVAAVKLLIVNSNFIALPKSHYVSSNRLLQTHSYIRSTSAMPSVRCSSVSNHAMDIQPSTSENNVFKESLVTRGLTRRDSDLTHVKLTKKEDTRKAEKRSSSFFPINSFRGLRDRMSSQFLKRNKSPSPERQKLKNKIFDAVNPFLCTPGNSPMRSTGSSAALFQSSPDDKSDVFYDAGEVDDSPKSPTSRPIGNSSRLRSTPSTSESRCGSIGSTSSGRQSRSVHARRGTINSCRNAAGTNDSLNSSSLRPTSPVAAGEQQSASLSSSNASTLTNRSLRRVSQSEQNSSEQRILKRRELDEKKFIGEHLSIFSNATKCEDLMSPSMKKKKKMEGKLKDGKTVPRRNTVEGLMCRAARARNRINIENQRRATCWEVTTIDEEKENNRNSLILNAEKGDSLQEISVGSEFETNESIMEMRNQQARMRRVGINEKRKKGIANNSESMMVLNGSMAVFENSFTNPSKRVMIGESEKLKEGNSDVRWREHSAMSETIRNRQIESLHGFDCFSELPVNRKLVVNVPIPSSPREKTKASKPQDMEKYMQAATSSLDYPVPPGLRIVGKEKISESSSCTTPQSRRKGLQVSTCTSPNIKPSPMTIPTTPKTPKTIKPISSIPLKKLDSIGIKQNGHAWVGEKQTVVSSPQPPRRSAVVEGRALSAAPTLEAHDPPHFWKDVRSPSPLTIKLQKTRSPLPSPVMRKAMDSPARLNVMKLISPLATRSKSQLTEEKVTSKEFAAYATPPRKINSPTRPSTLLFSTPNVNRRCFTPVSELSTSARPILKSTSSLVTPLSAATTPRPLSAMRLQSASSSAFESSPLLPRAKLLSPLVAARSAQNIKTPTKVENEALFKCPILPPMKFHEGSLRGHRKTRSIDISGAEKDESSAARHASSSAVESKGRKSRCSSRGSGTFGDDVSDTEFGFGDYNDVLKSASTEMSLPSRKTVESRPSVAMLRNSNSGLVQARINHFQGIELKSRTSMDTTTNSGFSQISASSVEKEKDRGKT